jgi:hypothetical protein
MIIQCIYVGPSGSGHHQFPSSLVAISVQMTRKTSLSRQSSLSNPTHTIIVGQDKVPGWVHYIAYMTENYLVSDYRS